MTLYVTTHSEHPCLYISLINTCNLFPNVKTKYEHLIEGPMKGDVKSPSPFLPRLSWLSHGTHVKLCWLAASVFGGILSWTSSLLQSWFTLLPVKLFKCIFSSLRLCLDLQMPQTSFSQLVPTWLQHLGTLCNPICNAFLNTFLVPCSLFSWYGMHLGDRVISYYVPYTEDICSLKLYFSYNC